ncbi:unnamed protein product [Polarella glacialis]|uniref:Prp18 domain-containing protein n=1 Tax=Polarella glacialis TaxID=89957 RepID=A0A813L318_POLGL|nr:unnamed protein product [Polarella glacialis]
MNVEGGYLATSRYVEDTYSPGHASVWGSWYCTATRSWGFACCRALSRDAAPRCHVLRQPASGAASASDAGANKLKGDKIPTTTTFDPAVWRDRSAFETPEGFLAWCVRHLVQSWQAWLTDGSLETWARSAGSGHSSAAAFLSSKCAAEASQCVEDFCRKVAERRLSAELVRKLEEMCISISRREYTHAYKVYMDVTIGSKKWQSNLPCMVNFSASRQDTEVQWTPDSGANPVDEAGVRTHIVLLRRLTSVAQALLPNGDPSKNCG